MNCFFYLDLQGLLFKIGYYFLLSQKMFGISWLAIQFCFSSSNITQPSVLQTFAILRLKTNQHFSGSAADPSTNPPVTHAVTAPQTPAHATWGSFRTPGFTLMHLTCFLIACGQRHIPALVFTEGTDDCWMWRPRSVPSCL